MEKKLVIQFLKEGTRGVYPLLVKLYAEKINSVGPMMALKIIQADLEKEAGETVAINYNSLAHAMKKKKGKSEERKPGIIEEFEFLDAHEIKERQLGAGRFKLP